MQGTEAKVDKGHLLQLMKEGRNPQFWVADDSVRGRKLVHSYLEMQNGILHRV